jgi:hypothetical protein
VNTILERSPGIDRLLLVIDNWEEIYNVNAEEGEQRKLVDELLKATRSSPLYLVLVVHAEFFSRMLQDRALSEAIQNGVVNIPPMTREEKRQSCRLRISWEFMSRRALLMHF